MGDFKDKNGKTRVGKFLQTLGERAAPIAEVALNVASDLTGIKTLQKVSDMIKGSDHLDPLEKEMALELLEMDKKELEEITKRWEADMTSDSWLSKNVRPITLIYLMIIMTILVIGDSVQNSFMVKDVWVRMIETLLITVFVAYFGSRGFEKYSKIKRK